MLKNGQAAARATPRERFVRHGWSTGATGGQVFLALLALVFWVLFVPFESLAQSSREWTSFKASDGMPETAVSSVTPGRKGIIWLTHPRQPWISRYDGFDFTSLPAPNLGEFQLAEGSAGQLWCLDSEGLKFYRPEQSSWTRINLQSPDDASPRTNLSTDRDFPRILGGRQDHVLLLYPDRLVDIRQRDQSVIETNILLRVPRTRLENFLAMVATPDGGVVILGTRGLARANVSLNELTPSSGWSETLFPSGPPGLFENPCSPVMDLAGGITLITGSGHNRAAHLDLEHPGKPFAFTNATGRLLKAFASGAPGEFLLFTQSGLVRAGGEPARMEEPPPANFVYDAAPGTGGSFWMACAGGLLRHAPSLWESEPFPAALDASQCEIAAGRNSEIWTGDRHGLTLVENGAVRYYPLTASTGLPAGATGRQSGSFALPVNASGEIALATGARGNVLFFASDQLWGCNSSVSNLFPIPVPGGVRQDWAIPLGRGQICLVSSGPGRSNPAMTLYDGDSFHTLEPGPPEKIVRDKGTRGLASTTGDYWFCGGGVLARLHQNAWRVYALSNAVPGETGAPCLAEISPGILWLGFTDRIMQFDGSKWSMAQGGFFHVHDILKASDGSVWVAAENGVHQFRKEVWMDNSAEEGLPANSALRILETSQGAIVALTTRGLGIRHPEADTDAPRATIIPADGSGKQFAEGSLVSFAFTGEDKWKRTPADRLLFSHRLDDREWSPYQEQRNASYADLEGGAHRLQVRCMDRNWNVAGAPASLDFSITAPWYRETRLVLISALGFAAMMFFAVLALNRHLRLVKSFAEVEAMVALRTRQLDLANRELFHSQKMNALGTLAAGIAHDFNNILSIIKGSAQIIEDNLSDAEKIRLRAERIRTVVEQGSGIVQAMLGFSSASGQPPAPCDVNGVVRETILLLGDRFLRDVPVRFESSEEPLPEVVLSREFARQILLNFIFNAADASPRRKPVIIRSSLQSRLPVPAALKPAASPEYVFVSVKDEGTGIAPDIMPRIFEPFFTTKALSSKRGTGLGLSMAYELARRMNCGLAVESKPGEGSVFTLIIPVSLANSPLDGTLQGRETDSQKQTV